MVVAGSVKRQWAPWFAAPSCIGRHCLRVHAACQVLFADCIGSVRRRPSRATSRQLCTLASMSARSQPAPTTGGTTPGPSGGPGALTIAAPGPTGGAADPAAASVVRAWSAALPRGDVHDAARYFAAAERVHQRTGRERQGAGHPDPLAGGGSGGRRLAAVRRELHLRRPARGLRQCALSLTKRPGPGGGCGSGARARVQEHLRPVTRDDHAVVKLALQVVLKLSRLEPVGQLAGVAVLAQVNAQTPVVTRRPERNAIAPATTSSSPPATRSNGALERCARDDDRSLDRGDRQGGDRTGSLDGDSALPEPVSEQLLPVREGDPAAARAPGARSPSRVAATTGQPAP